MINTVSRKFPTLVALVCSLPCITFAQVTGQAVEEQLDSIFRQMNQGSSREFSDAIDTDALLSRVFDGLAVEQGLKARFSATIRNGKQQLGKNILKSMPKGAYAKVLNVRQDGDKANALVRYDYGNRGFGYHDYELIKNGSGIFRIVDWLDYLDGERYSAALRLSVVAYDPTVSAVRGLVPEFDGNDDDYDKLAELMKSYRDKDFQTFYNNAAALPRNLRRTRFMQLLVCQVSRMAGDRNLYNNAYRSLSESFGDDPTVVLSLLGYYFSKGAYQDVSKSLRILQEDFGIRDAGILALMSRTALAIGNADEAAVLADEAIAIEPGLEGPYWAAINAHVMLRHYSFAVMTAISIEEEFGKSLSLDQFENNTMYRDFIDSPQFKQWQSGK